MIAAVFLFAAHLAAAAAPDAALAAMPDSPRTYAELMRSMPPEEMDLTYAPWLIWHEWHARERTLTHWVFPPAGQPGIGMLPAVARMDQTQLGDHWIPRMVVFCEGPDTDCAQFEEDLAALQATLLVKLEGEWAEKIAPLQAAHAAGRLSLDEYRAQRDALMPAQDLPARSSPAPSLPAPAD